MNKELKKLLMPYINQGWKLKIGGKHYKLYAPNNKMVTISATSSCPFYLEHVKGDIRKIVREMKNQPT